MYKVDVQGLKDLNKLLKQLPNKTQAKVMKDAVRKSLQPMNRSAKSKVPKGGTGDLKKALGVVFNKQYSKDDHIEYMVTVRRGKKFPAGRYGHMVEKGTSKMAAKPFLSPAFDETVQRVLNEFRNHVAKIITKEVNKLKK